VQTKLTLRLDEALIKQARAHAKRRGKSMAQLVADYFASLDNVPEAEPLAPVTRSLKGMLRGSDLNESDHRRHLEEKYL
jgi:hypothetical protein